MSRTDSLYQLIRALTKSEKRYFKLFASMQGRDKKYLLLFDAIDAQEVYNEEELKERFRSEKFVRQFSVAKNYLHGLILKSLRLYHSGSSTRYRLHEMLLDIEILSDKRLKSQARKLAGKAAALARRYDKYPLLLEAMVRQDGMDLQRSTTPEGIERMAREQREVLDQLANLMEYGFLFLQAARLVSRGNEVRTREQLNELDGIMAHPLLADEGQARSPRSLMRYHWIHGANHYARGRREESLRHSRAIVDLIENNADLLPDHLNFYVASISNVLLVYEQENNAEGFQQVVEKLRTRAQASLSQMKRRSREEAHIFVILYTHLLLMNIRKGEFGKCMELIAEIEQGMERYTNYIDDAARMTFYLHLSRICFAVADYRRALDYNNLILLNPEPIEGGHVYHAARLINLVIHYELGNTFLLRHLIPSTERFFRSRKSFHRFEEIVVDLLENLIRLKTPAARSRACAGARERLRELENDPLEQRPLQHFDYMEWLKGK